MAMTYKNIFTLILILLPGLCFTASAVGDNPFSIPRYSTEYDPDRDPFKDGRNALKLAKQTDRKVMIEVGGNWCQWCHILDEFLENHPETKRILQENFVVMKVNVSDENRNEKFFSSMPEIDGYPHVYITDINGSIVFSDDLSSLVVNGDFSEKRFLEFLNRWK